MLSIPIIILFCLSAYGHSPKVIEIAKSYANKFKACAEGKKVPYYGIVVIDPNDKVIYDEVKIKSLPVGNFLGDALSIGAVSNELYKQQLRKDKALKAGKPFKERIITRTKGGMYIVINGEHFGAIGSTGLKSELIEECIVAIAK